MRSPCWNVIALVLGSLSVSSVDAKGVKESERGIPVIYDVDVVVVGGASAGVAAAVAAAEQGATVFLAAPRTYLGEDLCGTYRLWLEPGEEPRTPLARKLFAEPPRPTPVGRSVPFTYETDIPSGEIHRDTSPPSLLSDGKWGSATNQSVQYPGNVTIIADLGKPVALGAIHLMAYQRSNVFELASVTIWVSDDKQTWTQLAEVKNEMLGQGGFEGEALTVSAPVKGRARYVKLLAAKSETAQRLLLGEIVIEPAGDASSTPRKGVRLPPTLMQVKRELDQALLDAGVHFLYGCYVSDVLRDTDGRLAGIVVANRSGRQAVRAKVIIDVTPRATAARLAGAEFVPYPAGVQTFQRTVIGGPIHPGDGVRTRKMPSPVMTKRTKTAQGGPVEAIEYTLDIPMKDGSFASFAEADHVARDKTWDPAQVDASEVLFQVPPDPMKGKKHVDGDWPGAANINLDAFRPSGQERLYVLGGCADLSRPAAAQLLRPLEYLDVGQRVGQAAAQEAGARPQPKEMTSRAAQKSRLPDPQPGTLVGKPSDYAGIRVAGLKGEPSVSGEVREFLTGARPIQEGLIAIRSDEHILPVLGEYDVAVVGGGTGGAPAGIGAARRGTRTIVLEYLHGLGGVGTIGLIGTYYHGYRGGFTAQIDKGVGEIGGQQEPARPSWNVEWKMEWYRRELRKAGAEVWFGVLGCGALVEEGRIKGVVVATPEGRGVITAKVVIDSTGNSDIAAAAGASCIYTDGSHVAVQGTGLPPREPGANYTNTDYMMIDDADIVDLWHSFIVARAKYAKAYDLSQIIDSRERRRIVGDFVISPLDIYCGRTYPDTVVFSTSDFDTHGYTVHPFFTLRPPDKKSISAYTPYRALLPKGLDGILVTGLGISAHRDAMPILRMQPDIQNEGYAAGVAASMAVRSGKALREIDVKALQKHLVEIGNVPKNVLTDMDNFAAPAERLASAVEALAKDDGELGLILMQPHEAIPLLRKSYASADSEAARLVYADVLGMLGDATGVTTLIESVRSSPWDRGWSFTGGGQFGASLSPLDSRIIALGTTRDGRALEPLLQKLEQLGPNSEFSHHRAIAVAMETLRDPRAAKPLADLLRKPGMTGYALTRIEDAKQSAANPHPNIARDRSLRELILARALFRCGDHEGLGRKILNEYRQDFRGHHARHATAVLKEKH